MRILYWNLPNWYTKRVLRFESYHCWWIHTHADRCDSFIHCIFGLVGHSFSWTNIQWRTVAVEVFMLTCWTFSDLWRVDAEKSGRFILSVVVNDWHCRLQVARTALACRVNTRQKRFAFCGNQEWTTAVNTKKSTPPLHILFPSPTR